MITSDHGFMLREKGDRTIEHGQGDDAMARYALYNVVLTDPERFSVSLRSLQYESLLDGSDKPREARQELRLLGLHRA